MMMHVDAVRLVGLRERGACAEAERRAGGDALGQESAPAEAAGTLLRMFFSANRRPLRRNMR